VQLEAWTGPKLGPGPLAERLTGVRPVLSVTRLDSVVAALRARRVPVYVPLDRFAQGLPVVQRLQADSASGLRNLRPSWTRCGW